MTRPVMTLWKYALGSLLFLFASGFSQALAQCLRLEVPALPIEERIDRVIECRDPNHAIELADYFGSTDNPTFNWRDVERYYQYSMSLNERYEYGQLGMASWQGAAESLVFRFKTGGWFPKDPYSERFYLQLHNDIIRAKAGSPLPDLARSGVERRSRRIAELNEIIARRAASVVRLHTVGQSVTRNGVQMILESIDFEAPTYYFVRNPFYETNEYSRVTYRVKFIESNLSPMPRSCVRASSDAPMQLGLRTTAIQGAVFVNDRRMNYFNTFSLEIPKDFTPRHVEIEILPSAGDCPLR